MPLFRRRFGKKNPVTRWVNSNHCQLTSIWLSKSSDLNHGDEWARARNKHVHERAAWANLVSTWQQKKEKSSSASKFHQKKKKKKTSLRPKQGFICHGPTVKMQTGEYAARKFGHGRASRSGSEVKEQDTFLLLPGEEKQPWPHLGDDLGTKFRPWTYFLLWKWRKGTGHFYCFQCEKNDHDRTWGANWAHKFGHGRISRSGNEEKERGTFLSLPGEEKRTRPLMGDDLGTKFRSWAYSSLWK